MSETVIYIVIFAVLMFLMHRGHGGMGGCGGHTHHGGEQENPEKNNNQVGHQSDQTHHH